MLSFIGRVIVQYSIFMFFFCFTFFFWNLVSFWVFTCGFCLLSREIDWKIICVIVKFGIGCCCSIDKFCEWPFYYLSVFISYSHCVFWVKVVIVWFCCCLVFFDVERMCVYAGWGRERWGVLSGVVSSWKWGETCYVLCCSFWFSSVLEIMLKIERNLD